MPRTASRAKRPFWICKNNHPKWRKDVAGSNWICPTCNRLYSARVELDQCVNGHLRKKGARCNTCAAYHFSPWLAELDRLGETTCPAGHKVSHHDDSIMFFGTKKLRGRRCRICQVDSAAKARSAQPDWKNEPFCKNGLHEKNAENFRPLGKGGEAQCVPCWKLTRPAIEEREAYRRQKKRGLRVGFVDWVVVERLLKDGSGDMYRKLRRGTAFGPTWGERWVAYCTIAERYGEPEDLVRTQTYHGLGYSHLFMEGLLEWKKYGKRKGWHRVTLGDIRLNIHTENYAAGTFLTKGFES
jgi:hypothetical protein